MTAGVQCGGIIYKIHTAVHAAPKLVADFPRVMQDVSRRLGALGGRAARRLFAPAVTSLVMRPTSGGPTRSFSGASSPPPTLVFPGGGIFFWWQAGAITALSRRFDRAPTLPTRCGPTSWSRPRRCRRTTTSTRVTRRTTLYASLVSNGASAFYNKDMKHALASGNDGTYSHAMIYSPHVAVIRAAPPAQPLREPLLHGLSVITAAAVNAGHARRQGVDDATIRSLLLERARRVLAVAAAKGHDALVLGAWGCGVFKNDPAVVADVFATLLEGDFADVFTVVSFALRNDTNRVPFEVRFRGLAARGATVDMSSKVDLSLGFGATGATVDISDEASRGGMDSGMAVWRRNSSQMYAG